MKVSISSTRQAHYKLPANSMARRGHQVTIYTSTPHSRLRGFSDQVQSRFVPAPVTLFNALTRVSVSTVANEWDVGLYDWLAERMLQPCDLALCAASNGLFTMRAAHRLGAVAVLDRACPHIQVQQDLVAEEARKVGGRFERHTPWFLERQLAEYEEADLILSPSNYSRSSFPERLQSKIVLAPLFGRVKTAPARTRHGSSTFTVGVVGGHPLRKGYLYLLQAWKQLALPNAKLLMRTSHALNEYPLLQALLASLPNVELVSYVPDIADFYNRCDAFVLPSVDDGFGMALFEAMANGVASIATRSTGSTELLAAGKDLLVVDAGSTEQIADALTRLYEEPAFREELGANGRQAIEALQQGDSARAYEDGIDRLLNRVSALRAERGLAS